MKNKVYNGKIGVKNGEKIIEWDFFSRKNKAKKWFWRLRAKRTRVKLSKNISRTICLKFRLFQTNSDIFQTFSDAFRCTNPHKTLLLDNSDV